MGQQQLLLIILGVIIVGIAIAVGLSLFSAQSVQANKDAIINDLNNLAAHAYQYRIRPTSMAGGGGTYLPTATGAVQYKIPSKMASNENASYTAKATADQVVFNATSKNDPSGTIEATLNSNGNLGGWSYSSYFE
jgi:hypothetical protein